MKSHGYGATEMRMAKTTVELPETLHRKLRVKAAVENRGMNDITIAVLNAYLLRLPARGRIVRA